MHTLPNASLSRSDKQQLARALQERARRKSMESTVIGFVSPVTKQLTKSIVREGDDWVETDDEPTVYLAEKLERVVLSTKRFIALIGGRGSSKSLGVGDIRIVKAKDQNEKTYCLREFQSSIKNSVMSLLKEEIERLEMAGFEILDQAIRNQQRVPGKNPRSFRQTDRHCPQMESNGRSDPG